MDPENAAQTIALQGRQHTKHSDTGIHSSSDTVVVCQSIEGPASVMVVDFISGD